MSAIPWLKVLGKFRLDTADAIGGVRSITNMVPIDISTRLMGVVPGYRITVSPAFPSPSGANIDILYNNSNGGVFSTINGHTYELLGVSGGGSRKGRKMKRRTMKKVRTVRTVKK